jgi:hypothetical protein
MARVDGKRHRDAERRAYAAFRRRSWQRHPRLVVLSVLCCVGIGVVGLVTLLRYDGDRPDRLTWLYLVFLAGSLVLFVMLIRHDDDPPT